MVFRSGYLFAVFFGWWGLAIGVRNERGIVKRGFGMEWRSSIDGGRGDLRCG
jgi:hypothetical protein